MKTTWILVADSSSSDLALKTLIADDPDLHVDDIGDAAAALQALGEQNYSIFLMDLMMVGLLTERGCQLLTVLSTLPVSLNWFQTLETTTL